MAIVSVSGSKSQISILVNFSSEISLIIYRCNTSDSDIPSFAGNFVGALGKQSVLVESIDGSSNKASESEEWSSFTFLDGGLSALGVDVFKEKIEVSMVEVGEEIVSSEDESIKSNFADNSESPITFSEDNLSVEMWGVSALELSSQASIAVLASVFSTNPSGSEIEGRIGLDLSREVKWLPEIISAEFNPGSDSLGVEFGFNVSAFNVGDELDFAGGLEVLFLLVILGICEGSLGGDLEGLSLSGVFNNQKLISCIVIPVPGGLTVELSYN